MPIDPHLLVAFAVTTIIAMISPGPDMLFVLGQSHSGGKQSSAYCADLLGVGANVAEVQEVVVWCSRAGV